MSPRWLFPLLSVYYRCERISVKSGQINPYLLVCSSYRGERMVPLTLVQYITFYLSNKNSRCPKRLPTRWPFLRLRASVSTMSIDHAKPQPRCPSPLVGVASGANLKSFVGCNCQTSRSESPVVTRKARVPLPLQTHVRVCSCRCWLAE